IIVEKAKPVRNICSRLYFGKSHQQTVHDNPISLFFGIPRSVTPCFPAPGVFTLSVHRPTIVPTAHLPRMRDRPSPVRCRLQGRSREEAAASARALYKDAEDLLLREYLDVMRLRGKARTWTNDDVAVLTAGAGEEAAKGKKGPKIEVVVVKNKKY
ncbi:hypothetical protein BC937DRAFT_94606, partial [Endogone sp. FLAS-F59071]